MHRHAVLDTEGTILNVIIYDEVSKYEIEKEKTLKEIDDDKFKYAEIGDKIVGDTLEKKVSLDVVKS